MPLIARRPATGRPRLVPLLALSSLLCASALTACDDSGDADPQRDATGSVDARPPQDAAEPAEDSATPRPDTEPSDAAADPATDAAPPLDAQPDRGPPDCTPGETACVEDGPPAGLRCGPDGRWVITPCSDGEVCLGDGVCAPDPATCVADDRVCLGDARPARCVPGEGWVEEPRCLEGWICSGDGRCRDPGCAVRAERSYLGCDFLAVDLQNIAYGFGSTPDAPLGVVLANADEVLSTRVWVHDADGAVAALVGEVRIAPPIVAAGTPAVTVRSELRDLAGAVVESGFERADPVDIPPGGMAILLLPHHPYSEASLVRRDAWTITTDRPVAAYQFSPYCCNYSFTNDASLLLPINALGTDYRYIGVPAWLQDEDADPGDPNPSPGPGLAATLTLVANTPATRVVVTLPPGAAIEADAEGRIAQIGNTVELELDRGEVAHLTTPPPERRRGEIVGVDLTGAHVASTAPIAAFTGHQCTYFPQDYSACDHLEEQLVPTDTWGTKFLLTPAKLRAAPDDGLAIEATWWKFTVRDPNTRIAFSVPFDDLDPAPPGFIGVVDCREFLTDPQTMIMQPGDSCEFATRSAVLAQSDQPIAVMGVISGQGTTGLAGFGAGWDGANAGDPSIFLLPPEYQLRADYAFLAPTTYFSDHLTVTARRGSSLVLDGQPVDLAGAIEIPGSDYVYAHLDITDGPHRISGDRPFGILVYAYDDWVSYAFTGGQNLLKR